MERDSGRKERAHLNNRQRRSSLPLIRALRDKRQDRRAEGRRKGPARQFAAVGAPETACDPGQREACLGAPLAFAAAELGHRGKVTVASGNP